MTPGDVRADPLEAAYRTIDRLAAILDRAWTEAHHGHFTTVSREICRHDTCEEIRKVLKP